MSAKTCLNRYLLILPKSNNHFVCSSSAYAGGYICDCAWYGCSRLAIPSDDH